MIKPKWLDALQTGHRTVDTFYRLCGGPREPGMTDESLEEDLRSLDPKREHYQNHGTVVQQYALTLGDCWRIDKLLSISAYCLDSPC